MYRVLAALRADMNEGWVWLGRTNVEPRAVVRISNKANGKKIYCECLEIDKNYLNEYNRLNENGRPARYRIEEREISSVVTMNSWYRKKLGNLEKNEEYDLEVKELNNAYGKLLASLGHPQIIVRVAIRLGLWSVLLGVISVIGVVLTIKPCFK